jgi:hypothetical protein
MLQRLLEEVLRQRARRFLRRSAPPRAPFFRCGVLRGNNFAGVIGADFASELPPVRFRQRRPILFQIGARPLLDEALFGREVCGVLHLARL